MEPPLEHLPGAATRLRDALDGLRAILARPALWAAGEAPAIVQTSLDGLSGLANEVEEQVRQHEGALARASEVPRESERDSRSVIDSIPGLVALLTSTGEVDFVNRQIADYTGQSLDELKQWGTNGTVHPEDLPHVIQVFEQSIGSGRPYQIEQRLRRWDGAFRWFQNNGCPLRDASGDIVRWCVLLTDIDERKRAEGALRSSGRDLTLIIDTIPALAWSARPDGAADFFNRHFQDYTGLSPDEASGWGWTVAVHPDDLQGLAATWQRIIASEAPGEAEARLRRHDGQYRWFLFRTNPLRDDTGTIVKWYGVNTDIEDRKRAEQELRRSEAFLAQAQRLTLTGSLWWKVATSEITWSDESYRLMGYPRTTRPTVELILDRVHPDDVARVRETVERSAREGADMDFEHRLSMPDGTIKHVHVVVQNVGIDSGAPEFMGAVVDITGRKRAEAELRRAYDSFADAQRLSHTGNFTADIVVDEHVWSEELYRIFEFDPAMKISVQAVRDVIHPEDLPSFDAGFAQSLGGADFDLTFRIVTRSGTVKHVRSFARLVERVGGRPLFIGAIQDVTEAKSAEEALNRARSDLAHVARVTTLSTLTASIAHEVNQPLSGIITNAGTCLRMLDGDPPNVEGARETARRTIRDGHRASEVITRLRTLFSKRESTLESLDVNEAIQEVIALSRSDLQRDRIVMQAELADDLPNVAGDRIQLQQVILNLLRNASDAMADVHDRPRRLLIRTGLEGEDRVWVSVRDAGIGIDPHSLHKLFDAFYTTKREGMGIGLSISRSIIESHHGRLWAEPNDGPGATFAFWIPRGTTGVTDTAPG